MPDAPAHPAFTLLNRRYIREIQGEAFHYRHTATGGEVVSVVCADDNKSFGISFRTPPGDSTGVAHILEHCVLCGSRKYPLKEPFKELLKGSLQTFLNAMTYPDKTVYPVASRNLRDFYNLVDVYLDAVFFPRLGESVFRQEGWHWSAASPEAPLSIQGVVYNEMKGNYSSPDSVAAEWAQRTLFPDATYGQDSGGDPRHIPDLSYEAFAEFHRRHYTPAAARAFFWGDDDPGRRLEILDAYFRDAAAAGRSGLAPPAAAQPLLDAPRQERRTYQPTDEEGEAGHFVTLGWLIGDNLDLAGALDLAVLTHLLVGTPASPLRKALIESGLGDDLAGSGFEPHTRPISFSTGLKGVAEEDVPEVERLMLETLERISREGFEPELVEGSLNHLEFSLRENNTGTFPRGLACFLRAATLWNHGGDPLEPLAYEARLAGLRERLAAEPNRFARLTRERLLENSHRVTLVVAPDPEHGAREARAEAERIAAAAQTLGAEGLARVAAETQALAAAQGVPESPEALATIPMLTPADLETRVPGVEKALLEVESTPLIFHPQPTHGIVYLDLGLNLLDVEESDLTLLPLYARALTEMGTLRRDYAALSNRIAMYTGGLDATLFTATHRPTGNLIGRLMLRGKATVGRLPELLDIVTEVLTELDTGRRERFQQMLGEELSDAEDGLVPGGHSVVRSRLAANFSLAEDCTERMDGVDYLRSLREWEKRGGKDFEAARATLDRLHARIAHRAGLVVHATAEPAHEPAIRAALTPFLRRLPAAPPTRSAPWQSVPRRYPEGLTLSTQVQFIGQALSLYPTGYAFHGGALVAARWLRNGWLWDRVRVQGGAYGCLCGFDHRTGVFTTVSYRDPNTVRTLEAYDGCAAFLREVAADSAERQRAIIGAAGDLNPCLLPDAKGYGSFIRHLTGVEDAFRQRIWDEVRGTQESHLRQFADALEAAAGARVVSALGSRARLRELEGRLGPLHLAAC
jgi:Zn-dependent M16 (insulinase) family peptidase